MKNQFSLALGMAVLFASASGAVAGADVNVSITGYLPAPPGVHVYVDGGRPCYREGTRVVYLERDTGRPKRKHGHAYGHRKHEEGRGHRGHR